MKQNYERTKSGDQFLIPGIGSTLQKVEKNCVEDSTQGTPLFAIAEDEATEIDKDQVSMFDDAMLHGETHKLPEGYKVKEGCEYSEDLQRYLWNPQPNDLVYNPEEKELYLYEQWSNRPGDSDSYIMSMDGYALIKKLSTGISGWIHNITVRKNGIPIQQIEN